jgi:hypothetical protein
MIAPSLRGAGPFLTTDPSAVVGTPKVSPSFTVVAGDQIVVIWGNESQNGVPPNITNSGTAQTWASRGASSATSGYGRISQWSAVASVSQSMTVTIDWTDATTFCSFIAIWVFQVGTFGSIGSSAVARAPVSGTPSGASRQPNVIMPLSSNSYVCAANVDWSAVAQPTRYYDTAMGVATEALYAAVGTNYTIEVWSHADTGPTNAKTVGFTQPMPYQTWTLGAVEVTGTGTDPSPQLTNAVERMRVQS